MDALASIQFQDVTRQQVEQVVDALNRLDAQAGLLARKLRNFNDSSIAITPLADHLDEIYSSYVMSSQRQTHNDALKGGRQTVESTGPKVELF
jgi:methyl-accepting chemotaxis protein